MYNLDLYKSNKGVWRDKNQAYKKSKYYSKVIFDKNIAFNFTKESLYVE